MGIGRIDKNLYIEDAVKESDIQFLDVRQTDAVIYGLHEPDKPGPFCRMPDDVARKVSTGVANLARQTSGGRVRFRTDSSYVAIRAEQLGRNLMSHMPFLGSSGFDCYLRMEGKEVYCGSFVPHTNRKDGYESILHFPDRQLREVTINFPLYDQVDALYLGVQQDAVIQHPRPYRIQTPVVFYGSSITQGGCASRPGNSYEAILSRRMDFDYQNFGFSGSALGEETMARYLAGLDMSIFVLDYDYNAPDTDHLRKTHWNFYQIIRQARPKIPIILITRPTHSIWPDIVRREHANRQVIWETYCRAMESGDSNIYWVEGHDLFGDLGRDCTVDGAHPNDMGFYCMADGIGKVLCTVL